MHTFDFRNTIVPFSLLDLRQHFKEMRPGDSLEVLWSDSTAADDLLRVLPAACIEIVSTGEISEPSGGFRMELIKTRMEPPSFQRRETACMQRFKNPSKRS
jgi:TusA-related sulfurtransferase